MTNVLHSILALYIKQFIRFEKCARLQQEPYGDGAKLKTAKSVHWHGFIAKVIKFIKFARFGAVAISFQSSLFQSTFWTTGSHKSRKHVWTKTLKLIQHNTAFWCFLLKISWILFWNWISSYPRDENVWKLIKFSTEKQSLSIEKIINWTMCSAVKGEIQQFLVCVFNENFSFITGFTRHRTVWIRSFIYMLWHTFDGMHDTMKSFNTWTVQYYPPFNAGKIINEIREKSIKNVTYP